MKRYPLNALPLYFASMDMVVGRSMRIGNKRSAEDFDERRTRDLDDRRADTVKVDNDAARTTKQSASGPALGQRRQVAGSSPRRERLAGRELYKELIRIQKAPIHHLYTPRFAPRCVIR